MSQKRIRVQSSTSGSDEEMPLQKSSSAVSKKPKGADITVATSTPTNITCRVALRHVGVKVIFFISHIFVFILNFQ